MNLIVPAWNNLTGVWSVTTIAAHNISFWNYDTEGHAEQCVDTCCEFASKSVTHLKKVANPCTDHHQINPEDSDRVGELALACSQIAQTVYSQHIG